MRILALVAITFVLSGCTAIQDGLAFLTGAPTNAEINTERVKLQDAERKTMELGVLEQQHRETVHKLTVVAEGAEERKTQVRALYARMAAELANLSGAAADAMVETMANLQRQLTEIANEADAAAAMAASYEAQADELKAARRKAAIEIAQAEANLDGFQEATTEAINSTLAFIGLAGESATSLGVPGAREVAGTVKNIAAGVLTTVLGSGTAGMGWLARRRRKRAEKAELKAGNLGRIVTAVEKFGLIGQAPGSALDDAKAGAKDWAGAEAHTELKRTLFENGNLAAA